MQLEAAGRPTVVVATDRFVAMAARASAGFGLADPRVAVVPHPIGGVAESELERYARQVADSVMALFTPSSERRGG